jgi:hypothetical protein
MMHAPKTARAATQRTGNDPQERLTQSSKAANNRRASHLQLLTQGASAELRQLARAVRRIHDPMRANPEAVYAAKDAIAARLIRIAEAMEARR